MSKRADEPISRESMEALTQEFIAYEIPSWGLIIGIMVSFFFVLAVQGTWLWRTERMEHFGWIGSVTAVVFGIILTGIGVANRFGVPETAASLQLVQAIGGTDDVRSEGMIGVYRQEQVTTPIGTTAGGQFAANMTDQEGSTRRMITTDLGAYHWEGYAQPTGLRLYQSSSSKTLVDRVSIEASLNAEGLVGQLRGLSELGTDTIIATQRGRLGVTVSGDGSLIAPSEKVLDAGQYIDAAFLGDVQDRHQRILKQLFENPNWRDSLSRPHLLAWLKHWDHGLQLGNELVQQGETLISVPFVLNRPADETEVLIPSPFISYSSCLAPDGSLPTGAWDDKLSEWQERSSESTTWLRFQIPQSLMPLKPTKARLNVKVSGDMGQLEILGAQDQSEFTLQLVNSPAGSLSFEIDNTDAIRLSPDGGLRLGIRAGRSAKTPAQPTAEMITNTTASYWQIESLSLELMATTTGLQAEE